MKFLYISISVFLLFTWSARAQDDWHFVDESATRLPDTINCSFCLDAGNIFPAGPLDILAAQVPDILRNLPGNAQLFQNNGVGFFDLADSQIFPQRNDYGTVVLLFDMDEDGDLDAFVANFDYLTDYVAINNGSGSFSIDWARLPIDTANALYGDYADIDGDGDIDMCLLGNNQGLFAHRVWINNGQGFFHDEVNRLPNTLHSYYRYIGFADLNGDLAPDIVAVYYDYDIIESHPTVFINDGAGHFTDETSSRLPQTESNCWNAILMDIDGDKDFDILLSYLHGVGFLINDGTGHFIDESAERGPLLPGSYYASIDADNDGDEDLIIGSTIYEQGHIFINDGTGYCEDQSSIRMPSLSADTEDLIAADLDGDGDADLFRVGMGYCRNSIFINTLNTPDSIPPHIMNQTILPQIDTARAPYSVKLIAKDGIAIPYQLSVHVHYSTDRITYYADSMHYTGGYIYYGVLPEIDSGQTVYYYYSAEDKWNNTAFMPINAPESVFSFTYLPGYDAINDDGAQLPQELSISAYPNPFNSVTKIIIKGVNSAKISITDIDGRTVAKIYAQHGRAIWNASAYPSGIYFARLEAGEKSQTIKMVLLK
jgi:hypothetical protein